MLDEDSAGNEEYTCEEGDSTPSKFNQNELNDLVRDLYLSKDKAELLGWRLKRKNVLASGTTFAWYRHREKDLLVYFAENDDLVYCLSLIHISEPTRLLSISYAVFCLKKKMQI